MKRSDKTFKGLKPFSKQWWWEMLLTHVYLCKFQYRSLDEFNKDQELTLFIIGRIERKIVQQWVAQYVCDQAGWNDGGNDEKK